MVNKLTNIKERVLQIAKYKEIPYEKFCENIGMTYGSFKGAAKERPLNSDAIDNIISIHSEINADWLITGNGEMLKTSDFSPSINQLPNTITEDKDILRHEIELLAENKYLKKRLKDLELENERMLKELDMKNELIKSFYEGRISYIPSEDQSKNKGSA